MNNFAQYGAEVIQEQVQNRGSIFQIRKQKAGLYKLVSHVSNVRSQEKFGERRGRVDTLSLCSVSRKSWLLLVAHGLKGFFHGKKRWYCKYLFSPCHIACWRYIVRTVLAHITWSFILFAISITLSTQWTPLYRKKFLLTFVLLMFFNPFLKNVWTEPNFRHIARTFLLVT